MNIISFSIRRPVTISAFFLVVSLFGIISFFRLPIEVMPDMDLKTMTILVNIRGGMPSLEVEGKVTKLVEESLGDISGLEDMWSLSKAGESVTILGFSPYSKMDRISLEVREKIARIKNELPPEAERPVIGRFSYADMPVFIIGVTGRESQDKISELVEQKIKNRFLSLEGIANVEVMGGEKKRVIFELDKGRLAALGIDIREVLETLASDNINLKAEDMRTLAQYKDAAEMKEAVLFYRPGRLPVRLSEIGEVREGYLEKNTISRLNGREVISIYIQKERTANTLAVTKNIKKELKDIETQWQGRLNFITVTDQGRFIEESFSELHAALIAGIILAVSVLVLFLKDTRSIVAVVLVIPVSLAATFFMLFICGLTLNMFTLSAIALGVGMLVDNALVIGDNISRRRRHLSEDDAVTKGGGEVGFAMFASTLTNIIVFLPFVFLKGDMEGIFRSIGLTISFSITFSLISALTIVPLVMRKKDRDISARKNLEKKWIAIEKNYERILIRILRKRKPIVAFLFIIVAAAYIPFVRLGKDLMPPQDEGRFVIHAELPSGARLEETDKVVRKVEQILKDMDSIESVSTQIENWSGKIFVTLKPSKERRKSTEKIMAALRPGIKKISGGFIYFEESQNLANQEIVINIFGDDYNKLRDLAVQIAGDMGGINGIEDVKIKMREGRPEMRAELLPEQLASYGVTSMDIGESMHGQMRGLRPTYLHTGGNQIETIVRLRNEDRETFNSVGRLIFYTDDKSLITLNQVSDIRFGLSPCEIWHKDKKRIIQLSARRNSRMPLSTVRKEIDKKIKNRDFPLDYFYDYGRQFYQMELMQKEFILLIILTIVLVYMVLASFFESYTKPFIIILMVPLSFSAVAFFQALRKGSINLGVLLGLVILGGMVVNSAILYMDRIRLLSSGKYTSMRILIRAASERLRTILMTGTSSVLGLIPIAFLSMSSINLWSELAKTIITGLVFSILSGLFIIPAVFSFFAGKAVGYTGISK